MEKSVVYLIMFSLFLVGITTCSLLVTHLVIEPMKQEAVKLQCAEYNSKGVFEWNSIKSK